MARIFLSLAFNSETTNYLSSSSALETPRKAKQIALIRELYKQLVLNLRSQHCQVMAVPETLPFSLYHQWINEQATVGDISLTLQPDFYTSRLETRLFYLANNTERKKQADILLLLLVHAFPQLKSWGSQPDTVTPFGRLAVCREINIPSLLMTVPLIPSSYRSQWILGLKDGLMAWSREVSGIEPSEANPEPIAISPTHITLLLNDQPYEEQGLLIQGNAYIPVDLGDRLGIDVLNDYHATIPLYADGGVVYFPAIELRESNISLKWDHLSQTLSIRSILPILGQQITQIMGQGFTSEVQKMLFLKQYHDPLDESFSDLAKLYQEEASIEGVNGDLAFCQMCLESNFLHYPHKNNHKSYNFANLLGSYPDVRLGVRAHIQHLKAYGNSEPLVQKLVDPRFHFVKRGIASSILDLGGRWSSDRYYGQKLLAMLRRLYEFAGIL